MKTNPILKELWETKDDLSQECGHDLRRLFDKLKASEKSQSGPIVNQVEHRGNGVSLDP